VPDITDDAHYGEDSSIYLESFAVLPKYRGMGIGSALVNELVKTAKRDGYMFIVGHYNSTSLNVLTQLGADVIEEVEDWGGTGETYSYARLNLNKLK
jgi:ribosomal protein S18 acetylase RimI-like enzyme